MRGQEEVWKEFFEKVGKAQDPKVMREGREEEEKARRGEKKRRDDSWVGGGEIG